MDIAFFIIVDITYHDWCIIKIVLIMNSSKNDIHSQKKIKKIKMILLWLQLLISKVILF